MRLFPILFLVLLGFLVLIIALWHIPEPTHTKGHTHPKYETMQKSGTNQITNPTVKWLGFGFGLFTISLLCFGVFIGARKNGQLGSIKNWLVFGTIAYFMAYSLMVWSYWNYVSGSNTETYFFHFPAPTAWMMYAVFFTPCIFACIYILGFNKWVLTPEDMERFHQIRAEYQASNQE